MAGTNDTTNVTMKRMPVTFFCELPALLRKRFREDFNSVSPKIDAMTTPESSDAGGISCEKWRPKWEGGIPMTRKETVQAIRKMSYSFLLEKHHTIPTTENSHSGRASTSIKNMTEK